MLFFPQSSPLRSALLTLMDNDDSEHRSDSSIFLLSSDCYNKMPQTRWLIYSRILFSTVLEAGGLRSEARSREDPLSGGRLLTVSLHGGRGKDAVGSPV